MWRTRYAIYVDPTEPTRYATLAYTLLLAYVAAALGVLALLRLVRLPPRPLLALSLLVHAGDVCFAAVVTLFTEGPNSPFFVFFVFALMEAAYRWGLAATLYTAGAAVGLLVVEAMLVDQDVSTGLVEGQFELNRLVIRATYLVIVGVLVGYLGESQRELRMEQAAIAWVMAKPRVGMGVKGTVQVVLEAVLRLFGSPRALRAVSSGRATRPPHAD